MNKHHVLRETLQFVLDQLPTEAVDTFPPVDELLEPLTIYWQLLQRWNAKIKLTGANTIQDYAHRHIADSLFGWWAVHDLPTDQTYLDIGAGAGFPSFPLALLRSDILWTLVESHSRRAAFLQQVKRALQLDNTLTKASRITGNPEREKLDPPYDGIVFRAVNPEQILPIAQEYLRPAAQVIYWGTPAYTPPKIEELTLIDTFSYTLPSNEEFCLLKFQTQS